MISATPELVVTPDAIFTPLSLLKISTFTPDETPPRTGITSSVRPTAGVPVTDAEAGLVPAEFVAVTEQLYAVLLVSPLTKSGLLAPEAVFDSLPAVQVTV